MTVNHVFFCHNLITLYKSIAFSKIQGIENNSCYVYMDYNAKIADELLSALSSNSKIAFCHYPYDNNEKIPYYHWKKYVKSILFRLNQMVESTPIYIHVYLDMWAFMPSLIENIKTKYGNLAHIYMHEEGYAMYAKCQSYRATHYYLKSFLYYIFGLSTYGLTTFAHGNHPNIERIYCSNPDKAFEIGKRKGVEILYEGVLFSKNNLKQFLNLCSVDDVKLTNVLGSYEYIFLSQPVYDVIGNDVYKKFVDELFYRLSGAKILIKLHPRDTFNYSDYINNNIKILEGIPNLLPFECLFPYVSNSTILTFNSSCCANINPIRPSVYMYRLLKNESYNSICERVKYDSNIVKIADSFEDFI